MARFYRYTTPVPKSAASGLVADVYRQVAADFILGDGPLMSLSPAPDLLAATWSVVREAQIAGRAPRVDTEAVAAAVSAANRCRFCLEAHTALVHAAGDHALAEAIWRGTAPTDPDQAALIAWARATTRPDAVAGVAPPFPSAQAPEYLAAALVTHFLNRLVAALLDDALLPRRLGDWALVRRLAGGALGRAVRRQPRSGESLPLLGEIAVPAPVWAGDTPIATAYSALVATAERGGALLSCDANEAVIAAVETWNGESEPFAAGGLEAGLERLPPGDRPGARLALLAALAPHAIADADVAAWRAIDASDAALIRLTAFGAITSVRHIEAWTVAALTAPRGRTAVAA
jgi:AhpD family alkylhydroperoxidase